MTTTANRSLYIIFHRTAIDERISFGPLTRRLFFMANYQSSGFRWVLFYFLIGPFYFSDQTYVEFWRLPKTSRISVTRPSESVNPPPPPKYYTYVCLLRIVCTYPLRAHIDINLAVIAGQPPRRL